MNLSNTNCPTCGNTVLNHSEQECLAKVLKENVTRVADDVSDIRWLAFLLAVSVLGVLAGILSWCVWP